jgi:hypothetical protein
MVKILEYREHLRTLKNWDTYLLQESGLPGPRGNLELAQVVAEEGDQALFQRYIAYAPEEAPTNSPYEFLVFCGVVGLGRLLAEGQIELLPTLRRFASDPRWRTREGVAMALQRWGEVDMPGLLVEMENWAQGIPLEQRAAAAALCEPRLLSHPEHVREVLHILDSITGSIVQVEDRRSPEFQVLRKGLGYCWSVAVAALPEEGEALMEKWIGSQDRDIKWIMKENLSKKRLLRMDAGWVEKQKSFLMEVG